MLSTVLYVVMNTYKTGNGVVNKIINKLPFELHIPGYQFCGPGTKLRDRLDRGETGINPLDSACRDHDIKYSENPTNLSARHDADKILTEKALQRVFATDASVGEKASALLISSVISAKRKMGMSLTKNTKCNSRRKTKSKNKKKTIKRGGSLKKTTSLRKIVDAAKRAMSRKNPVNSCLKGAKIALKKVGGKRNIRIPRILPLPKIKHGGVLPLLLPIFAGISAAGGLAGGLAGVVKAVNDVKNANKQLAENKRHNQTMEAIALGKGLYLKPYRRGLGLHFSKNLI